MSGLCRDARVRYLADRIVHSCRSLVVVPEPFPTELPLSPPEGHANRIAEGRLAAARLRSHGPQGLIARSLLWLHLHERAEALAIVGLAEGGAEALKFAAKMTPASQATVAVPFAAKQEARSRVFQSPHEMPAEEPRGLPQLDSVIALHPSKFDIDAVAATLTAPTLALFDEPTQEQELVRVPHAGDSTGALHARAAAFDKALRKHAQTRDHCVRTALRGSARSSSDIGELVSSSPPRFLGKPRAQGVVQLCAIYIAICMFLCNVLQGQPNAQSL